MSGILVTSKTALYQRQYRNLKLECLSMVTIFRLVLYLLVRPGTRLSVSFKINSTTLTMYFTLGLNKLERLSFSYTFNPSLICTRKCTVGLTSKQSNLFVRRVSEFKLDHATGVFVKNLHKQVAWLYLNVFQTASGIFFVWIESKNF